MNSTGVKLNKQELRNAEFYGEFKSTAYDLAYQNLNNWRNWKIFNEQDIARMSEVEETSDLMIMMLQGVVGKSQPNIDKAYKNMDELFTEKSIISKRFSLVMDKICLLYTSPSPRDRTRSRMPSSA